MKTQSSTEKDRGWRSFLRKHWPMLASWIVAAAIVAVGTVYVFIWFINNAQSTGLVPSILGQWSLNHLFTFILHAIYWELILVGIPVIISSLAGWWWWRRIPIDERSQYHFFESTSRTTSGGGGAFSILFWIAFSIRVYLEGNWNVAISSWTLDYIVNTSIWTAVWLLIIFGIPLTIIGIIWWINNERKKMTPQ